MPESINLAIPVTAVEMADVSDFLDCSPSHQNIVRRMCFEIDGLRELTAERDEARQLIAEFAEADALHLCDEENTKRAELIAALLAYAARAHATGAKKTQGSREAVRSRPARANQRRKY